MNDPPDEWLPTAFCEHCLDVDACDALGMCRQSREPLKPEVANPQKPPEPTMLRLRGPYP